MKSDDPATLGPWWVLGLAFAIGVTGPVMLEAFASCPLYYDLGLYTEALIGLNGQHPNPMLGARRVHLFNDHFDPILWLAAPFGRTLPPYGGIVLESVVVGLGVVPLAHAARIGWPKPRAALLLALLTLFNLGTITAVHFPIHPTTWALAPWVCMAVALARKQWLQCTAAFILLMACKEEFPFVGLPLAYLMARQGAPLWAATVLGCSLVWLFGVYGLRPVFVGPVVGYARLPFAGLVADPAGFWRDRLVADDMAARLLLFGAPLVPTMLWLHHLRRLAGYGPYVLLTLPPMALRFAGMTWRYHYHAVTVAGLTMALLPALRRAPSPPRWLLVLTCALLAVVNGDSVQDLAGWWRHGRAPHRAYCPLEPGRQKSIARGVAALQAQRGASAFVGCNLHPHLAGQANLFLLNGPQPRPQDELDWVFFEKPPHGMAWPSNDREVEQHISAWRTAPQTQVVIDDAWVFLARGAFRQ